jgi:hypothetical protein
MCALFQSVDNWKQKPVSLTAPETVDVDKFAKVIDKPEKNSLKDNPLVKNLFKPHHYENVFNNFAIFRLCFC